MLRCKLGLFAAGLAAHLNLQGCGGPELPKNQNDFDYFDIIWVRLAGGANTPSAKISAEPSQTDRLFLALLASRTSVARG